MNKILIPFDESENAKKTIEYVSTHISKDHEITLFYVVPNTAAACGLDSPSLTPYFEKERNSFCRMEEQRQEMMQETLAAARNELLAAGFDREKIFIKAQPQNNNIAADIVQEAQTGRYSMVAMGRRASSGLKEFFIGSNASRVMHALNGTPMIIVD
jgi:nucleotide-binding universal stress UspA family protein